MAQLDRVQQFFEVCNHSRRDPEECNQQIDIFYVLEVRRQQ